MLVFPVQDLPGDLKQCLWKHSYTYMSSYEVQNNFLHYFGPDILILQAVSNTFSIVLFSQCLLF